jgi:hypothetical protein
MSQFKIVPCHLYFRNWRLAAILESYAGTLLYRSEDFRMDKPQTPRIR